MNRYAQRVAELTAKEDIARINANRIKLVAEEDLRHMEAELGCSLPADYREFVRDYGGIWFGNNQCRRAALYHLQNWQWGRASIHFFYDAQAMFKGWQGLREQIPTELVPLGECYNDRLFLAVKGQHAGSIYQWYADPYPEEWHYYPELELIARSFDSFLYLLKPLDDEYYKQREYYIQEKAEIAEAVHHLEQVSLSVDNAYTSVMNALQSRYVYVTLGEDAKQLSEAELKDVEREIGAPLPSDYREFLRSFGGYCFLPHPGGIPHGTRVNHPYGRLKFFHGCIGQDYHDFMEHYRRLVGYLPSGFIPIANAGEFCLKVAGANAGAVYKIKTSAGASHIIESWTVDTFKWETFEPLSEDALALLTPSFDAFVRSLRRSRMVYQHGHAFEAPIEE